MRKYGVKRWDLGVQLRLDSRQNGVFPMWRQEGEWVGGSELCTMYASIKHSAATTGA